MIKNPFIVSGRIPDPYFCDRVDETRKLIKLITNGNNIVMISPRRMGKTELIKHCYERNEIKDSFYTVFIDILQTSGLQEFIYLLGKSIYESFLPKNRKLAAKFIQTLKSINGTLSFDPVSNAPLFSLHLGNISRPEYTLQEIFSFVESLPQRVIIAIDEFQQITNYPEKNVEAILRTYIQDSKNCNFIFAGSRQHLLKEMFLYPARPFYNSTSLMQLDVIPRHIYAEFAGRLFKEHGRDIDREALNSLYDKFDGYTYYMQKVLNRAFADTERGASCDNAALSSSLSETIEDDAPLFRELMSDIPLRQKELLISIARQGEAASLTSSQFIRQNALNSASSVQSAAKKLLHRNLISKNGDSYTVTDKFFALWLRKEYL